jgi:hypothetical protein
VHSSCRKFKNKQLIGRSQQPLGVRCGSAAARLLRLWVPIQQGVWTLVSFVWCALSGSGLCDRPIPRLQESYRLQCFGMCDLKNKLKNEEAMTRVGPQHHKNCKCLGKVLHHTTSNTVQCLSALRSWESCYLVELLKHSCIAFAFHRGNTLSQSEVLSEYFHLLQVWS